MAVEVTGPLAMKLEGAQPSEEELRSLRGTVEWLRREGLLLETEREVSGDLQLTGVQKHLDGTIPVLFRGVTGYPEHELITNLFTSMQVIDRWFGWKNPQDRTRRLAHALTHPIPPVVVDQREAPCQEEVLTEDLDVNRYVVPIRHTALESELTIGSGCSVVVGDKFHGGSHVGYNRMNFRWGDVGTFQSAPGSHMWQVITENYRDEGGIPITMCFGLPVAANLIAGGGFD
ncbi:MAG TPA: UbiD family decarboxylase domain-containing protein, partial [Candidatus Binatia bacterium]|nr:UbiD family decarboxylase domain-containing protein [Candidatus Binatia bacterium]